MKKIYQWLKSLFTEPVLEEETLTIPMIYHVRRVQFEGVEQFCACAGSGYPLTPHGEDFATASRRVEALNYAAAIRIKQDAEREASRRAQIEAIHERRAGLRLVR